MKSGRARCASPLKAVMRRSRQGRRCGSRGWRVLQFATSGSAAAQAPQLLLVCCIPACMHTAGASEPLHCGCGWHAPTCPPAHLPPRAQKGPRPFTEEEWQTEVIPDEGVSPFKIRLDAQRHGEYVKTIELQAPVTLRQFLSAVGGFYQVRCWVHPHIGRPPAAPAAAAQGGGGACGMRRAAEAEGAQPKPAALSTLIMRKSVSVIAGTLLLPAGACPCGPASSPGTP